MGQNCSLAYNILVNRFLRLIGSKQPGPEVALLSGVDSIYMYICCKFSKIFALTCYQGLYRAIEQLISDMILFSIT